MVKLVELYIYISEKRSSRMKRMIVALSIIALVLAPLTPVEAAIQNSKNSKETTDRVIASIRKFDTRKED